MARECGFHRNAFDVIRLLAALQVIFGHMYIHYKLNDVSDIFQPLLTVSQYIPGRGVIIFFAVSGFLAMGSIERARSLKEYVMKKFIRIYPELIVCFIVNSIIILVFFGVRGGGTLDYLVYAFTQLTIFQFYTGEWLRGYGVGTPNGALWTITVIIQFYGVIFFAKDWMKSTNPKRWELWILISALISVVISNSKPYLPIIIYKLLGCSLIPYAYIFLIGLFCYRFFDELIPYMEKNWVWLLCLYVVVRFVILKIIGLTGVNLGVNYDVFSATLLSLISIGIAYRLGEIRFKHELSYGLFLWHMVVVNIGCELMKTHQLDSCDMCVLTGLTVAISAMHALGSQICVAIPVRRFLEQYKSAN